MTIAEAGKMIDFPSLFSKKAPDRWADLGCGSGTFTLALADALLPGSVITAVDSDQAALKRIPVSRNGVALSPLKADLLQFIREPGLFDGILMANALHFIRDQEAFLVAMRKRLKPAGFFLLVEYDMNSGSRWVPYPLSPVRAEALLNSAGFTGFTPLARRPSRYGPQFLYSALVRAQPA